MKGTDVFMRRFHGVNGIGFGRGIITEQRFKNIRSRLYPHMMAG